MTTTHDEEFDSHRVPNVEPEHVCSVLTVPSGEMYVRVDTVVAGLSMAAAMNQSDPEISETPDFEMFQLGFEAAITTFVMWTDATNRHIVTEREIDAIPDDISELGETDE